MGFTMSSKDLGRFVFNCMGGVEKLQNDSEYPHP